MLNARTDAFVHGRTATRPRSWVTRSSVGRAYLDAGAPVVFVPGLCSTTKQISTLVDAFGPQRLTVIGFPGSTPLDRLEKLGVAGVSYGPQPLRVALTALQELVEEIHRGGGIPMSTRQKLV